MEQDKITAQKIHIKTYSVKEMAGLYEISKKTLNKGVMDKIDAIF